MHRKFYMPGSIHAVQYLCYRCTADLPEHLMNFILYILIIIVNCFAVNVCIHTDVQFGINLAKGSSFSNVLFMGSYVICVDVVSTGLYIRDYLASA